jgi:hypothetical protein
MKSTKISTLVIIAGLFLLQSFSSAHAQEKPARYLFQQNGHMVVSGFGGVLTTFSTITDEFAVTVGGGGAALFNNKFFIGGYGEGLSTEHYLRDLQNYNQMQLTFGHGGLWLGYIHNPHQLVHWNVNTKIGWGGVGLAYPGFVMDNSSMIMTDVVFVLSPQLEMEVNLFPWMKFTLGAGYRWVNGVNQTYEFITPSGNIENRPYFSSADFNSITINAGFLFGNFIK